MTFVWGQNSNFLPILNIVLVYAPTRLISWKDPALPVRILVKMECENSAQVPGNKWWKLKYNLDDAVKTGLPILTFGGAFSNHIFATAAGAHAMGLHSIGIIRGETVSNPLLDAARRNGMNLEFISRTAYRSKSEPSFLSSLKEKFGDFFLIPEGGTNEAAIRGCQEWGEMLQHEINFDIVCLPVGTGGTMAGLISSIHGDRTVVGFSSLKDGAFLERDVSRWITKASCNWRIETDYDFGGYAKQTKSLTQFIAQTWEAQGIELDPVYTCKTLFGVIDMARKGKFAAGSTVLVLHTGGIHRIGPN
jgi:1-aminocyclopropane-1-carboxylate deaminase